MANRFNTSECSVIDRANRPMYEADIPMSVILNDLYALIDEGNIGIVANAEDVDSLAKGGGHAVVDEDLSTALDLYWKAFRLFTGLVSVI